MNIHFVYATPNGETIFSRAKTRLCLLAQKNGLDINLFSDRANVDTSHWPLRAPYSITQHVYRELKSRWNTLLYDWREEKLIRGGPRDILIGHPFPEKSNTVWNRSCLEGEFATRIAMTPLSHQMPEVCGRLEPYLPVIDSIYGIMGPYWYDTWEKSALAHWKSKILPIDMAININQYPRIKKKFNPAGKRKFFYIGWSGAQKGTHLLSILFGLSKNNKCIWIGEGDEIPNVEKRGHASFTAEYLSRLADECDMLITLGVSDANPTTILESMAWGFPVCCTPQSGYHQIPEIVSMSTTNMEHNVEILNYLQNVEESKLISLADSARELVTEHFTWERFNKTIIENVQSITVV